MATVGRRPTPTAMKLLAGNPGRRPLNEREPESEPLQNLKPPKGLTAEAKRAWTEHAPGVAKSRVLTEMDRMAFAMICKLEAECIEIEKKLRAITPSERYRHPLEQSLNERRTLLAKLWSEFGMTPSSRARLKVEPPKPHDPASEFMGGGEGRAN